MIRERKTARLALASAILLASGGCSAGEAFISPGNTGPYATIARVAVLSGPTVTTVDDSVVYRAAAYDNDDNVLSVTFRWHTDPSTALRLHDSTGAGRALAPGRVQVWATAGTAVSAPRFVTVNPRTP